MWHVFDLKNKKVLNWGTVLKSGSWSRLVHKFHTTSSQPLTWSFICPQTTWAWVHRAKEQGQSGRHRHKLSWFGSRTLLLLSVHLGEGESGSAKFVFDSHCHQAPTLPPVHCTSHDQHVNYCRALCFRVVWVSDSSASPHNLSLIFLHSRPTEVSLEFVN